MHNNCLECSCQIKQRPIPELPARHSFKNLCRECIGNIVATYPVGWELGIITPNDQWDPIKLRDYENYRTYLRCLNSSYELTRMERLIYDAQGMDGLQKHLYRNGIIEAVTLTINGVKI
tara:strand:- start:74 stop:430 length:357 start_codon:yes stop_codon:yes gene_type:complete